MEGQKEDRSMLTPDDFMYRAPRRLLDWREDEEGRCVLLRPKLGTGRWGRWAAGYLGDPYYQIKLDEVGTMVWKASDGTIRLSQIAEQLRHRFGNRIEPAEARLHQFVQGMRRSRLIELPNP